MKAEFTLKVDKISGEPFIQFIHHDRSNETEQLLLGVFVRKAKKHGIKLLNPMGILECGTDNSIEKYEIRIK